MSIYAVLIINCRQAVLTRCYNSHALASLFKTCFHFFFLTMKSPSETNIETARILSTPRQLLKLTTVIYETIVHSFPSLPACFVLKFSMCIHKICFRLYSVRTARLLPSTLQTLHKL